MEGNPGSVGVSLILWWALDTELSNSTLLYYENKASELSLRYESARLDAFHQTLHASVEAGAKIIEIGCGSGRDAARALAHGYDIVAIDGSAALLSEASRLHPELAGRLICVKLPAELKFSDNSFDGFFSVACFMHFTLPEIRLILAEVARVLKKGAPGLVSLPASRGDVNNDGIDEHGRIFNLMSSKDWINVFEECGFVADAGFEEADSLGRPNISWVTFLLKKN